MAHRAPAHAGRTVTPRDPDAPDEAERRRRADGIARLRPEEVEKLLGRWEILHAYPAPLPDPPHREGVVDWCALAGDRDAIERFVTRLVQTEGLWRLRDQLGTAQRVTYVKRYPRDAAGPHVVFDHALAARLGVGPTATVARVVEAVVRIPARGDELPALMKFLYENGERGPTPLPRAGWIEDVRLYAPSGAAPPADGQAFVAAWSIETDLTDGPTLVLLARAPIARADRSRPITVNASLRRRLIG